MAKTDEQKSKRAIDKQAKADLREARLREQLRTNLRKRKSQVSARKEDEKSSKSPEA